MMATKVTEASLTCSICLRRFRKPRTLPCLHSYCEECLIEYAPSGTQILMCPLCQEKIPIPDGKVTKFKLDFRLESMVEDARRYEREAGIVSEVQVCNCCKDEGEAIAKCEMCKQMLCKFGLKAHENLAGLRDHVVTSLTQDILASDDMPMNRSKKPMDNLELNEEEDEEEIPVENRAILVSNIPRLQHSPERIRDRLTMHFQKKRNGGGDVDGVLYPLEACPQHAVVVFTDKKTCSSVLKTDQFLEDFQAKVSVESCPQVFKMVEAEVDIFYWNLVPRLASSKLIDELSKMFGKSSLQTSGHILRKVTCTIGQLQEVHSAIVKAVGLLSSGSTYSVIESGIFIKDIPYLTDETEQLREELKNHLGMEGTCQLQALLCPIKGGASEAIAIFKTSQDCTTYMEQSDKRFFGEPLRVVKLPPVFKLINAHLEDLFGKLIKHLGTESLRSYGLNMTRHGTTMIGNSEEIMKAATAILEIIGLYQDNLSLSRLAETGDASTQTPQTLDSRQQYSLGDASTQTPQTLDSQQHSLDGAAQARRYQGDIATISVKDLENEELATTKHVDLQGEQSDRRKAIQEKNKVPDKAKVELKPGDHFDTTEFQPSLPVLATASTTLPDNEVGTAASSTSDRKPGQDGSTSKQVDQKQVKLGSKNTISSSEYQEQVSIEHPLGGPCIARQDNLQTSKSGSNGVTGSKLSSTEPKETPHPLYEDYVSIDAITYRCLQKTSASQLQKIETKLNVLIEIQTPDVNTPADQIAVFKPQKKASKEDQMNAKEAFIKLYQELFFTMKRVSLKCDGLPQNKATKAQQETERRVQKVVIQKDTKGFVFCGKEDDVREAVSIFREAAGIQPKPRKPKRQTSSGFDAIGSDEYYYSAKQEIRGRREDGLSSSFPSTFCSKEGLVMIISQDDITKQEVDIIVNAANARLDHSGGVAGAISRAAGKQLQRDCNNIMYNRQPLRIGQCIETKGYRLPCRFVIHALGPMYQGQNPDRANTFFEALMTTFMNILVLAEAKGAQTIAIPLISSGNFGGPKTICANALAMALYNFSSSTHQRSNLQQIFLVNRSRSNDNITVSFCWGISVGRRRQRGDAC
ncbi:uncharacterized protein [Amphiura filiformis]|uniref:uncharacterized protein n=1 Tax=Amphiura filiformis TaxID=82378 RepID=UPI003B219FCA